jgi:hypothetical protein
VDGQAKGRLGLEGGWRSGAEYWKGFLPDLLNCRRPSCSHHSVWRFLSLLSTDTPQAVFILHNAGLTRIAS